MPSPEVILFARAVSRLLGWIYFLAWSLSFYAQPLLNIRRRATTGSTIDFPSTNLLGFLLYLLSNGLLYWSSTVRHQYAVRNPVSPEPTVQANDVAFAAHAALLSVLVLSMFWGRLWGFKQVKRNQAPSRGIMGIGLGCVVSVLWVVGLVIKGGGEDARGWAWIDVVYAAGYSKLVITVVKYIPQVWTNYKRKSTTGWSIYQILLDLVGGVLSIAQLLIDSSLQDDWTGLTGNPVKFVLGNVSIIFDVIFMSQHFWLYRDNVRMSDSDESQGLIASERHDRYA